MRFEILTASRRWNENFTQMRARRNCEIPRKAFPRENCEKQHSVCENISRPSAAVFEQNIYQFFVHSPAADVEHITPDRNFSGMSWMRYPELRRREIRARIAQGFKRLGGFKMFFNNTTYTLALAWIARNVCEISTRYSLGRVDSYNVDQVCWLFKTLDRYVSFELGVGN